MNSLEPLFFTSKTIKKEDIRSLIFAKLGFKVMDKLIMGLAKGNLTIVSGLPGSGKSIWLSQMALELVEQGEKVAMFSGELTSSIVLSWLQTQAAGRDKTIATDYADYFKVDNFTIDLINDWLEQQLFVYNNKYGNNHNDVLEAMKICIEQKGCRTIILDNLMTLDISKIPGNSIYEKQSGFFKLLKIFARDNDIHVIIVAHPRKPAGFLRVEDILGTADIRALADNIWLVHRVNDDFKRASKQDMSWKDGNSLYEFGNIVEIAKSRFNGSSMGSFVGFYYEIETKRFLSSRDEYKHYKWETEKDNLTFADTTVNMPFDL